MTPCISKEKSDNLIVREIAGDLYGCYTADRLDIFSEMGAIVRHSAKAHQPTDHLVTDITNSITMRCRPRKENG
jgi:hypothetical protein